MSNIHNAGWAQRSMVGSKMTDSGAGSTRSSSSDGLETCLENQQELLEGSLRLVFTAYDQAAAAGMGTPVVILLDCEDPIGADIARSWLGEEAVDVAIEQIASEQSTPDARTTVFAHGFAWDACQQEIPSVFPYLAQVFAQPPPRDGFLAISVTSGGASVFTVPWDAREQN